MSYKDKKKDDSIVGVVADVNYMEPRGNMRNGKASFTIITPMGAVYAEEWIYGKFPKAYGKIDKGDKVVLFGKSAYNDFAGKDIFKLSGS